MPVCTSIIKYVWGLTETRASLTEVRTSARSEWSNSLCSVSTASSNVHEFSGPRFWRSFRKLAPLTETHELHYYIWVVIFYMGQYGGHTTLNVMFSLKTSAADTWPCGHVHPSLSVAVCLYILLYVSSVSVVCDCASWSKVRWRVGDAVKMYWEILLTWEAAERKQAGREPGCHMERAGR